MPFYPENNQLKNNERKDSSLPEALSAKPDFFTPKGNHSIPGKGVFSAASFRKASLALEAALVVPVFFLCLVTLIQMSDIYRIYAENMVKLQEKAEKTAVMTVMFDEEDNMVSLFDSSFFSPVGGSVFGISRKILSQARVRSWTGRSEDDYQESRRDYRQLVYVTDNQSVYHTSSACTHLSLTITPVLYAALGSSRNESGSRYKPCEKCVGSGAHGNIVYVTHYGDCYHNSLECSGLKRSVKLVDMDKISNLKCCEKCAREASLS